MLQQGERHRHIAAALNDRGIRHRVGRWTADRVRCAVLALQAGHQPGPLAMPRPARLTPRIVELAREGLGPQAIADRLQAEGARTRFRRPVTLPAVKVTLARTVGYRSPRAVDRDRASELLVAWGAGVSNAEAAKTVAGTRTQDGARITVDSRGRAAEANLATGAGATPASVTPRTLPRFARGALSSPHRREAANVS
jgi:hypothetical protein